MPAPLAHNGYVGVFDSGVGGISVLKALVEALPHESFLYFGDSAWAPYGEKPPEQVVERSRSIVKLLVGEGCKAVVIACNTATSVAASILRAECSDVPIVGVEPALKPAALDPMSRRILVMATPMTLRLEKYQQLAERWGSGNEIISVPCPGLAARIEKGDFGAADLADMLDGFLGEYRGAVDAVVLGCTHYSFVAEQIREAIGDVPLYDGAAGTARQLARVLDERGLLARGEGERRVEFASSCDTPEEIAFYESIFAMS